MDGDRLVIDNVRNFNGCSDEDFDQRWEQRVYDLSQLQNVDLILSYWGNEAIAHLIICFGFNGGRRLDFSIETRKERGEQYSTIAGFFKQYELVIIAADERDVVRVRSNVRGKDVRIYRLRTPPEYARRLLREYLNAANNLTRSRDGITPPPATARRWCSGWLKRSVLDCHSTTASCYPVIFPTTLTISAPLIRVFPSSNFANYRTSAARPNRPMRTLLTQD
ncbi:MAG: DUF4105 domain-containing protein [Acetobacteraceae bacterium]|nr:DUF4105 domain-containing protein [Acetobacteraceae bacterium]